MIAKLRQKIIEVIRWIHIFIKQKLLPSPDVIFQINQDVIHRYLFNLNRSASEEGVRIGIILAPNDKWKFHQVSNKYVYRALLKIKICKRITDSTCDSQISPDYFLNTSNIFRIPVGTHPLFPVQLPEKELLRNNTVCFAGSRDPIYATFPSEFWNMPSRTETIKLLNETFPDLVRDRMKQPEYIDLLRTTRFFICLPGLSMPLCHNLYESIACGCIPIIHESYSAWLHPGLQEILRPTTYSDDRELTTLIFNINAGTFSINEPETRQALNQHFQYSNSWRAISDALKEEKKLLICAEEKSLDLARKKGNHV